MTEITECELIYDRQFCQGAESWGGSAGKSVERVGEDGAVRDGRPYKGSSSFRGQNHSRTGRPYKGSSSFRGTNHRGAKHEWLSQFEAHQHCVFDRLAIVVAATANVVKAEFDI